MGTSSFIRSLRRKVGELYDAFDDGDAADLAERELQNMINDLEGLFVTLEEFMRNEYTCSTVPAASALSDLEWQWVQMQKGNY